MKKYFKLVGKLELICWFIGIIVYVIRLDSIFKNGEALTKILSIILLIVLIILGPAVGLLFIWVADATNDPYTTKNPHDDKINENKVIEKSESSQNKEKIKEPVLHNHNININNKDVADASIYESKKRENSRNSRR